MAINIQVGVAQGYVDTQDNALGGRINTNQSNLQALTTKVNTADTKIAAAQSSIDNLRSKVDNMSTQGGISQSQLEAWFEEQKKDLLDAEALNTVTEEIEKVKVGAEASQGVLITLQATLGNVQGITAGVQRALEKKYEDISTILNGADDSEGVLDRLDNLADLAAAAQSTANRAYTAAQAAAQGGLDPEYVQGQVQNAIQGLEIPTMENIETTISNEITHRGLCTVQEVTTQVRNAQGVVETQVRAWVSAQGFADKKDIPDVSGLVTQEDLSKAMAQGIDQTTLGDAIDDYFEHHPVIADGSIIDDAVRTGTSQAMNSLMQEVGDMKSRVEVMSNTADDIDFEGLAVPETPSEDSNNASFNELVAKLQEKPVRRADVLKKVIDEDAYYWYVMPVIDQRIYRDTKIEVDGHKYTVEYGWQKAVKERYWYHKQDADMRDHYIYLFRSDINSIEMKASAESTAAFGKIDFKPLGGDTRRRKSKLEIARNIPLLGDLLNPAANSKQTIPTKQNAHIGTVLPSALTSKQFQIAPEVDLVAVEGKNIGNINSNKTKTSGNEVKLNSGADLNTTPIHGFRRRLPQILIPSKIDWHAVQNELDLRDGNYPSDFYYIGCYAECDDSSMYESHKFFEDENKYLHLLRKEDSGALFYMDGDEKCYVDAKDARTYYVDAEGTKPIGSAWEDGGKVPTRDILPSLKRRSFADVSRDIKVHMLPIYLLGSTGIAIDVEDVDGDGKYNYVTIDSMISPMAPSSKDDVTQDNKHLFTAQTVNVENGTNKLILGTSTHKQYFSKNTYDYVQGVFNYVCRDNVAMAESGLPCVYGQGYTWLPLDAKGEADDTTGLGVHCTYFQDQMWIANGVYSHYNGLIPSGYTKASLKQMTTMYKYKIVEKFIRGHWNESNGETAHNVWENDTDDGNDNGDTVNETPIFLNDYSGDGIADLNEPIFDISIDDESVISYNIKEAYVIGNDAGGGIGVSNWIYDTLSYLTQKGTANTNNIFLICVADDGDEYIFDEYIWEAGKVLKLNEQKRIKYAADLRKVEFVSTNIGKARAATKTPDNRNIAKDSSYSAAINGFDQLNKELISTDNIRNYLYNEELGSTEEIANPKYKPAVTEVNHFRLTNPAFDNEGMELPAYEAEGEWPGEDKPDMNLGFYNIMFFWDMLAAMYKVYNQEAFREKLTNFVEGICKMNEEIDVWTFMSQLMNNNKDIPGFEEFSTWVIAQINAFAGKEHELSIPIEGGEPLVDPESIFEYMTSKDHFPEEIRDKFDMDGWREYVVNIISSYISSSGSGIYIKALEDPEVTQWDNFEAWVASESEPDIIKNYKLDNEGKWSYEVLEGEGTINDYAVRCGLVEAEKGAIIEGRDNEYLIAFKNENGFWVFDKEDKCIKRVDEETFNRYTEENGIKIPENSDQFSGLFDCAVWYMMWQLNRGDFHTKCEAFHGVVQDVQSVLKESHNPEAQIRSVFHPLNWDMGAEPWEFEYTWRPGQAGNGEPAKITLYHYNEVPWQIDDMIGNARNTCRRYNKILLFLKSVETDVDLENVEPPFAATYNFDAYRWTPSASDYIYIGTKSYTKIVNDLASLKLIPNLNKTKEAENPGNDTASQIADQTNSRFEELRRKIEWLESGDFEALILNKMPQLRGLLQSPDFAKDANGNVRVKETPVIQEIRAGVNTMVGGIQAKLNQLATVGNNDNKGINIDASTGEWSVVDKIQAPATLPETPAPTVPQPTTNPTQTLTMPTPSNLGKVRGVRNLSGGNLGLISSRF